MNEVLVPSGGRKETGPLKDGSGSGYVDGPASLTLLLLAAATRHLAAKTCNAARIINCYIKKEKNKNNNNTVT